MGKMDAVILPASGCDWQGVLQVSRRRHLMARFDLSDREWSIIGPLLPNKWRGFRDG
jgi:hypothetical protein